MNIEVWDMSLSGQTMFWEVLDVKNESVEKDLFKSQGYLWAITKGDPDIVFILHGHNDQE